MITSQNISENSFKFDIYEVKLNGIEWKWTDQNDKKWTDQNDRRWTVRKPKVDGPKHESGRSKDSKVDFAIELNDKGHFQFLVGKIPNKGYGNFETRVWVTPYLGWA